MARRAFGPWEYGIGWPAGLILLAGLAAMFMLASHHDAHAGSCRALDALDVTSMPAGFDVSLSRTRSVFVPRDHVRRGAFRLCGSGAARVLYVPAGTR